MKKDYDYIARLEKAISKKYGEETIQNPKSSWDDEKEKEYLKQLKLLSEKDTQRKDQVEKIEIKGFLISKKLVNKDQKRICPVCEIYSFNMKDDLYMSKYDCCFKCYVQYVEFREERWTSGWRPEKGK